MPIWKNLQNRVYRLSRLFLLSNLVSVFSSFFLFLDLCSRYPSAFHYMQNIYYHIVTYSVDDHKPTLPIKNNTAEAAVYSTDSPAYSL